MFEQIRNRQATTKHLYVQRPAYTITEAELSKLETLYEEADAVAEYLTDARLDELRAAVQQTQDALNVNSPRGEETA